MSLDKIFEDLRLTRYLDNFRKKEVIYEDLANLTGEDLKLLIPKNIPRRRLLRFLRDNFSGKLTPSEGVSVGESLESSFKGLQGPIRSKG